MCGDESVKTTVSVKTQQAFRDLATCPHFPYAELTEAQVGALMASKDWIEICKQNSETQ